MLHNVVCVYVRSVCVCVYMCVRPLHFIHHAFPLSETPHLLAPSLKVVNEHRNTVGSHQVVGVSGERLVLPAFWVTWGQTDGMGGEGRWVLTAAFYGKPQTAVCFKSTCKNTTESPVIKHWSHLKQNLITSIVYEPRLVKLRVCGRYPSTVAKQTSKSNFIFLLNIPSPLVDCKLNLSDREVSA